MKFHELKKQAFHQFIEHKDHKFNSLPSVWS